MFGDRITITIYSLCWLLLSGAVGAEQSWLDLRDVDWQTERTVKLDGQWGFVWGQLLPPDSPHFADLAADTTALVMQVPGLWNRGDVQSASDHVMHTFPPKGFATLSLNLRLPATEELYYLRIPDMPSAYRLFVNQKRVAGNGTVGISAPAETPGFMPKVVPVQAENGRLQLSLQLSNFHHKEGGVWHSFEIAPASQLFAIRDGRVISDLFFFTVLFSAGCFFLCLYLFRRRERAALAFSLFCLAIGGRSLLVGERLIYGLLEHPFFPWLDWSILQALEHQLFFAAPACFAWFCYYLYPQSVQRLFPLSLSLVSGLFIGATWIWPLAIYAQLATFFQLLCMIAIGYLLIVVYQLIRARRKEVWLFAGSFIPLLIAVLHDLLYTHLIIGGRPYLPLGVVAFVATQSFLLNRRYVVSLSLVESMSHTLKRRNRELTQMDKVKDEFLAHTSHELRTPIHGMAGLAESLLASGADQLNSEQKHQLQLIESSAKRLGHLVNEVLDFSQLKYQELRLVKKPVNIAVMVEATLRTLQPLTRHKKLQLINQLTISLPMVEADENRLQQILFNLLGNAVKYTPQGKIWVRGCLENNQLRVWIEDTGPGIDPQQPPSHDYLFSSLRQVKLAEHQTELPSNGLGLSITRKLLELHGSDLVLENRTDMEGRTCGTRASFALPLSQAEAAWLPGNQELNSNPSSIESNEFQYDHNDSRIEDPSYVLVVDDEEVNCQVVKSQLLAAGYSVKVCHDGYSALRCIDAAPPALVLLDYMMPDMNGLQLCDLIREQFSPQELPVIMLTARNQVEDVVQALGQGANDYMTKPYERAELLARIDTQLRLREAYEMAEENQRLNSEIEYRRQAEQQLATSTERLKALLQTVKDGIILCDADFKVLFANDNAERFLGASQTDLIGQSLSALFSTVACEQLQHLLAKPDSQTQLIELSQLSQHKTELNANVWASVFEKHGQRFYNIVVQSSPESNTSKQADSTVKVLSAELLASQRRVDALEQAIRELADHPMHAQTNSEPPTVLPPAETYEAPKPQLEFTPLNTDQLRLLMVNTMRHAVDQWEQSTQNSKIELAEQSQLWRVYVDGGTIKTRTLDKYLSLKQLPKRPRWRLVVRTVRFVCEHCAAISQDQKRQLLQAADQIEHSYLERV